MSSTVLSVKNLTKYYKKFLAVDDISFEIKKGQIIGLLGPNGAGKSTTIQMLLGLTEPTSGTIEYFGKDLQKHRSYCLSKINFASAYAQLQGRMTVRHNLKIFGGLYNVKNIDKKIQELAELFEITAVLDETFWQLSSGQQTRAILAKSLLNDPELLLMDEPTASLDPDIIEKIIELIRRLQREKNIAILYTSHNMEEVSRLCEKVMFLQQGKIVVVDSPQNLSKAIGLTKLYISYNTPKEKIEKFLKQKQLQNVFLSQHQVEIAVEEEQIPSTLFDMKKNDIWITGIDIVKPNLEDVFLSFSRNSDEMA